MNFEGMNYSVVGAGSPILLLHGWGANGASFSRIAADLSADFSVYSIDFWGFGQSDAPVETANIYDYARVVAEFIEVVIASPVIIVGHSFGGRVALIIGEHPLVSRVVLVDSAGLRPKLSLLARLRIKRYKRLKAKVRAGELPAARLEKFGSAEYRALGSFMRAVFVRVVNEDLSEFARRLKKPTLIIWGRRDRTTPPKSARALHKMIANSRIVWLGGGHFSFLDSPREFLLACYEFFNGG